MSVERCELDGKYSPIGGGGAHAYTQARDI